MDEPSLFFEEDRIVRAAAEVLASEPAPEASWPSRYQELLSRYIKLLSQTKCLVSLGDLMQNDLTVMNERLAGSKEREKGLRAQLLHSQKMEALGTLAAGIAHEFNNILTVASGYTELILSEKTATEPDYADLKRVLSACWRGAEMVRKLSTFAGKTAFDLHPMDLNLEVQQTVNLLSETIARDVEIEADLAPDLHAVRADSGQIAQLIMNIALNARDAMSDGGRLTIKTRNVVLDEDACSMQAGWRPGRYAQLSVTDTGHGMDDETVRRVFEPFFTTRGLSRRSGLGLPMVHGILEKHGGFIECHSRVDEGTTFTVYLPVTTDQDDEKAQAEIAGEPKALPTILLVDDEVGIRDLGARILRRAGYRVILAEDAKHALEIYGMKQEAIGLVILDLIMPGMGGKRCLEELLRIDPEVKVLVSSGHAQEGDRQELLAKGASGFVPKPFQIKELLEGVRKALNVSVETES